MIASTSSGSSFHALGSYLERGKDGVAPEDRVAWVESRGVVRDVDGRANAERAARVMEATADLNPRCESPCYHLSVSFDTRDLPGGVAGTEARRVMLGVAERTLRDLGLQDHQVVVVAHGDKDHPHMHLMVNRVHPKTGRVWDRWKDRVTIERSLRAQERELGLREVPGQLGRLEGQERPARGLSAGAYRAAEQEAQRTGERTVLEAARSDVGRELGRAKTWDGLEGELAEHGYVLRAKGRGLVVRDGAGREVKASAVHRDGGRGQLERRFGETWRAHRARVEDRTGGVPPGLSPHAEAVVRAHRDIEGASTRAAAVRAAQERLWTAESSVRGHGQMGVGVEAQLGAFRDGLRAAYEAPAGAEVLFFNLERDEGGDRACRVLAQDPGRFGDLRKEKPPMLEFWKEPTDTAARKAAQEAAQVGEQYFAARGALEVARERDPRAVREARAAHGRAVEAGRGLPGVGAGERRLEGLGKALSPMDRRVLGRLAPGALRAVEKAVSKALGREADRGLGR